jgi:hypothetical protein
VRRQQFLVDPRLVVEALGVTRRHQLDQIPIAFVGLREQHQMIRRLAGRAALGQPAARRDVNLAAENRLDAVLAGVIVEDHRREHVAVLGDRNRRHLQLRRLVEQFVDPARTVEQRELGVKMKVDEFSHRRHSTQNRRTRRAIPKGLCVCRGFCVVGYSHSIVDGGFELMS